MRYLVASILLSFLVSVSFIPAHAKKQKWEIIYPDGKRESFQYDDSSCQMVGWQKKIKFSTSFDVLNKYKGSAGFDFSADRVRELDNLETDFGLQFEGLCKDYMMGVYKDRQALYDCRRGNINNALSDLRELGLLLNGISTIQDAAAKKESVSTILDKYQQHVNDKCVKNALGVQTDSIDFGTNQTERSVVLTNIGYFDISWSATDVPRGFLPFPPGGSLARNASLPIIVYRLADAPSPPPRSFLLKDNQNDKQPIQLKLSGDDAIQTMKVRVGGVLSNPAGSQDAIEKAASVVRRSYAKPPDELVYWVTGEILNQLGDPINASKSLSKAGEINPRLRDHPQFKLDVAKSNLLIGDVDGARKIVGDFLNGQPVTTQNTYQLEAPGFYQHLYTDLGDPAKAEALKGSLKANGYTFHAAIK